LSVWYLDTSAAIKLAAREVESQALVARISAESPVLVSSKLLETEIRRYAQRSDNTATQQGVDQLLAFIVIAPVTDATFTRAGRLPSLPGRFLKSLDAIHLAAALQVGADAVVTYDANLQDHAAALGFQIIAPTP